MARTVNDIAALLSSRGSAESNQDEKMWRTSQLKEALSAVRQENVDGLAAVVEKLADGARDPAWRLPIGDSGFLQFVLTLVPVDDPHHPLNKQALRLIGNACADCDGNRARVVESGRLPSFVMACLKHDALLPFAIAATLNVCVDYKEAQSQASEAGLNKALVDIVSGDRLSQCQSSLSHTMTILELLSNQDSEPKFANPNTPALLLGLATSERYDADLDAFMEICSPALAYLTLQDFQSVFLETGNFELLQSAFSQLYTRFDTTDIDSDTATQLKQVGNAFVAIFADISALPGFSAACPLSSKAAQTLIEWLRLPPAFSHLQTAACLSLGNLSRSDESNIALLGRVQSPLLDILSRAIPPSPSEPPVPRGSVPPLQLIHASLSFLKNLAIPPPNKPLLGAALLDPSRPLLPRLWTTTRTQPQLQFAAVSLARLLLVNCPANVRRMCAPLAANSGQNDSSSSSNHASTLALLIATAFSADEEPIKMEAARAASLVCRALHSPSPSSPPPAATTSTTSTSPTSTPSDDDDVLDPSWTWTPEDRKQKQEDSEKKAQEQEVIITPPQPASPVRARFYDAHSRPIATSLLLLLTQAQRFPSLRSDAIFVLALMSRSSSPPDGGARMALRVLLRAPRESKDKDATMMAAWRVLAEAVTGSAQLAGEFVEGICDKADDYGEGKGGGKEAEEEVGGDEDDEDDGGVKVVGVADGLTLEPRQQQQPPAAGTAKMDRENAMVLIAELLRNFPDELAGMRRPLEALLSKGGELVVQDRAGSAV